MLKVQCIGHLGADAVMNYHGTDTVLNFSLAKTDKYKYASGNVTQKTTWISCSWWVDSQSKVGQYLKKGTLIYAEGTPEAKMWDGKDGKKMCGLGMRIFKVELLGGKREDQGQTPSQNNTGYVPVNSNDPSNNDDDLPF